MSLWILQVSDLHFGQVNPPLLNERALPLLVTAVRQEVSQAPGLLVISICGDIVDKGNQGYYDTAARALEDHLLRPLGSPAVVCCPGNHDVVPGENGLFSGFNHFAFHITNKASITFAPSNTVVNLALHGFEFVLVNSMYRGHEDRHHGEVNLHHLDRATAEIAHAPRILLVHHSLIPNERSETSTLVNSYALIELAVARGFVGILHGHLHSQHVLSVGKAGTVVLGVGSLLYRPWPNYNNSFNLLRFDGPTLAAAVAFRFVADVAASGVIGTFQRTPLLTL
jgi:3',5'-cyclic AMP phosphodiesterase CpdA